MKKKILYPIAFGILILASLFYKYILSGRIDSVISKGLKENVETSETSVELPETEITEITSAEEISVYICGCVIEPGVYRIPSGGIVYDVITEAGGFTEDAAVDRINLVYKITENISIYVPTADEIDLDAPGEIVRSPDEFVWGQGVSSVVEDSVSDSGLININTASREELMSLPGIGEAYADAIIEYRNSSAFSSIEDIMNVSGIGESKFNRIRNLITV